MGQRIFMPDYEMGGVFAIYRHSCSMAAASSSVSTMGLGLMLLLREHSHILSLVFRALALWGHFDEFRIEPRNDFDQVRLGGHD